MDDSGRITNAAEFGLFLDSIAPADPVDAFSPSHEVGVSSFNNRIEVQWKPAIDQEPSSGVAGYSIEWSQIPDKIPDAILELEAPANGTASPPLPDGTWYFHLRTWDRAGNHTTTIHLGPFPIGRTTVLRMPAPTPLPKPPTTVPVPIRVPTAAPTVAPVPTLVVAVSTSTPPPTPTSTPIFVATPAPTATPSSTVAPTPTAVPITTPSPSPAPNPTPVPTPTTSPTPIHVAQCLHSVDHEQAHALHLIVAESVEHHDIHGVIPGFRVVSAEEPHEGHLRTVSADSQHELHATAAPCS